MGKCALLGRLKDVSRTSISEFLLSSALFFSKRRLLEIRRLWEGKNRVLKVHGTSLQCPMFLRTSFVKRRLHVTRRPVLKTSWQLQCEAFCYFLDFGFLKDVFKTWSVLKKVKSLKLKPVERPQDVLGRPLALCILSFSAFWI